MTRAQMILIMARYARHVDRQTPANTTVLAQYTDRNEINTIAVNDMSWGVANSLITGSNNRLHPNNSITRAQVVVIFHRFVQRIIGGSVAPTFKETLAQHVTQRTNELRVIEGLSQYGELPRLTEAANIRARELRTHFSHTRPNNTEWRTVLLEQHVVHTFAGENIAQGQNNTTEVMRAWMDSVAHRANILSKDYTHMGVGIAIDDHGNVFWVQMFITAS